MCLVPNPKDVGFSPPYVGFRKLLLHAALVVLSVLVAPVVIWYIYDIPCGFLEPPLHKLQLAPHSV
jgi:hypothetical protein